MVRGDFRIRPSLYRFTAKGVNDDSPAIAEEAEGNFRFPPRLSGRDGP